jgi:hypothetical protein
MAGSPPRATPLLSFGAKSSADARPNFSPAIGASDRPQCYQRVDVLASPVHPAAFQPHLDDHLVALSVLPLPIGYAAA